MFLLLKNQIISLGHALDHLGKRCARRDHRIDVLFAGQLGVEPGAELDERSHSTVNIDILRAWTEPDTNIDKVKVAARNLSICMKFFLSAKSRKMWGSNYVDRQSSLRSCYNILFIFSILAHE